MALKLNINMKNLPLPVKVLIAIAPAILIIAIVLFLFVLPKNKEIKALEKKIAVQENEIAADQVKVAKLPELTLENERLRKRLEELKQQLPEEKEVSTLLKQVSDLCISSGQKVQLWQPAQKKTHSSGIVFEIPVKVELSGSYHKLGYFFGSITKLNRIVNISDVRLSDPKPDKGLAVMKIAFTATTFSSVPEEDIQKEKAASAQGGQQ
ncbi:MAG: type 4a pilus biogenesis protein PilO [Thermodesulfovibrionales bacterium]|nr:type 4a pilus biogenesis protein PilO [Thermodesulfovibrionales bacterium]